METLFSISMLELFVGGGGRLLEVGPITVRMILFACCLCVGAFVAIRHPRKGDGVPLALGLVAAYLLVHLTAFLNGAVSGNDLDNARQEMQQSLYWLIAPFLAIVLNSHAMVLRTARLVRLAGVILAVTYIGVVVALALNAIDFLALYTKLSESGEFAFRSESFFFYKGFLYLGVSAVFFLGTPTRFSFALLVLIIVALAMTLTRGFVLSTAFAALAMLIAQRRWRLLILAMAAVACVAFFLWVYLPSQNTSIEDTRSESNSQRVEDFSYIVNNVKIGTLLVGEGLGALINKRLNIENTFLWAIWRLGVVGVVFWLTPLVLCLGYFSRITRSSPHFSLACAYFFSTILVYVQTMANPYLNNPIGLSFVLVALFSLRTLSRLPQPAQRPAAPAQVLTTDPHPTS